MPHKDAERLLEDLRKNSSLRDKFKSAGPQGFDATAKQEGYHTDRHEFADVIKANVVKSDLAGPKGFTVADGVVSGVAGGVSSHVSAVGTGVA